jgi:hypothetical protein
VEFPFLKKLKLMRVSFDSREKIALSSDAFPSLDILELQIENESDPFYSKILESCQRESLTPIKRVTIRNQLGKEELKALLMVPVETLTLCCTASIDDTSSDIPWDKEKIITKTLKKFIWVDYDNISSIAFLINCKHLESLDLYPISSDIDLSALSNLPLLKELSFNSPAPYGEKSFLIKNLFRSAAENSNNNNINNNNNNSNNHNTQVVVFPSLQKLELFDEKAISLFEGLENTLPNLRILESSARVDERENDENLLNSFLYLVRNFLKLEEIRFSGLHSFNTRIPRLLKKEKPSLIIYYPKTCQYEPEPEKEGTRRDRE